MSSFILNRSMNLQEIIKKYNSVDFFAKYLGQRDPEVVYETMYAYRF